MPSHTADCSRVPAVDVEKVEQENKDGCREIPFILANAIGSSL